MLSGVGGFGMMSCRLVKMDFSLLIVRPRRGSVKVLA